MKTEQANKR